jgi:hypothetical protein
MTDPGMRDCIPDQAHSSDPPDYSKRENGFDGFRHGPPHVLSQSYSFAAPVEALAVTQTVHGITPKYVL